MRTHLRGRGTLTLLIFNEKETIVHAPAFPSDDVATVTKLASVKRQLRRLQLALAAGGSEERDFCL